MKFLGVQFFLFVLLCVTAVMSQMEPSNPVVKPSPVACGAYTRGRRLPQPQGGPGNNSGGGNNPCGTTSAPDS